jgi:hypothetical protein
MAPVRLLITTACSPLMYGERFIVKNCNEQLSYLPARGVGGRQAWRGCKPLGGGRPIRGGFSRIAVARATFYPRQVSTPLPLRPLLILGPGFLALGAICATCGFDVIISDFRKRGLHGRTRSCTGFRVHPQLRPLPDPGSALGDCRVEPRPGYFLGPHEYEEFRRVRENRRSFASEFVAFFKRLLRAVLGRARGTAVVTTVDQTLMRGSKPHDR